MTIKINGTTVDSEVLPINKPTLDETLETFSFALKSSSVSLPYAPMQKVEITTDDDEVINLLIVSDTVEPFSLNPVIYKHNITCIENTRELSKHIVRNSVFSQPAYLTKQSFNACYGVAGSNNQTDTTVPFYRENEHTSVSLNPSSVVLPIDIREKIKKAYIEIDLVVADGDLTNRTKATWKKFNSFSELQTYYNQTASLTLNTIELSYWLNGQPHIETIDVSNLVFNKPIEFPRVAELRNQGASSIRLNFSNRLLIDGTITVVNPDDERYFRMYVCQLKIIAETYYYNAYQLLDLLIKRQQQKYSTVSGRTYEKLPLFKLPTSGELYNLLNDTIVPNFTFTQLTMYECVAEVFRLFDSIFTMSSDGTLGITYFNQANRTPITTDFTGLNVALSEDKYTNSLQSYYQEAQEKVSFPNNENYIPVRSEELGIPEQQDHFIIVPHEIHSVENVYFLSQKMSFTFTQNYGSSTSLDVEGNFPIDISYYIVEASVWSSLDVGDSAPTYVNQLKQNNTLYYERGSNKISIAYTFKTSWNITKHAFQRVINMSMFRCFGWTTYSAHGIEIMTPHIVLTEGSFTPQWYLYKFKVSYVASLDGTTKTHSLINKYDGETLIDQNNGAVDLNKLGLNMLGTVIKLGEPSLNATQKISNWSNRIKIGDVIIYQGERWIANVVAYNLLGNNYIQTKITFVKNFNALALYTKINRVRRFSNIANELTQKSEDVITNFVYFAGQQGLHGNIPSNFLGNRQEIVFNESYLSQGLYLSFANDETVNLSIDYAVIRTNLNGIKQLYIPMVVYGAGNTINFEMSYKHSMSAGYKTTFGELQTWYGADKYFTSSVDYTDNYGFLDYCDVRILGASKTEFSQDFPDITSDIVYSGALSIVAIDDYYVYKQPNEIFALNYQLAFLGFDHTKDFVGTAFINDNFFTTGTQEKRSLKIFYSTTNELYNTLDTKGIGSSKSIDSVSVVNHFNTDVPSLNYIEVRFYVDFDTDVDVDSYAICDDNDNMLFAFNTITRISNGYVSIFFKARQTR